MERPNSTSGGLELRPLDPDGVHSGSNDAPEGVDDPSPPPSSASRPSPRVVSSPRYSSSLDRRAAPPPPPSSSSSFSASASAAGDEDDYDLPSYDQQSEKRKRMVLLLLMTLAVALLGATVGKRSAMVVESGIDAGERTGKSLNGTTEEMDEEKDEVVVRSAIDHEGYRPKTMVNPFYVLPGTEDAEPLSGAKGRPYYPITNHFQTQDADSPYAKTWGRFDFVDPNPKWNGKVRPQPDFDSAPNRDVKNSDFPPDSWQRDREYTKAFLIQARRLVNRTIEAIYSEYGVGIPPDGGGASLSDERMAERELFAPVVPLSNQSADGIARRVIHHVMTGDTFKLVLGGHSAAAGHGAGFNQSYIIEAGHVLEPVFAHLGVEFRAYNFAQGGMGTFQQSMAGMSLRGKDADWLVWDSSMTEKDGALQDFFWRQGLIAGNRAPVLMGDGGAIGSKYPPIRPGLFPFHDVAGAAIAGYELGWTPVTDSDEQVKTVPWAAQWLSCSRTATTDCKAHEYTAGCWVDREDYTPTTPQNALVGGRASWHPGNRIHKHRGRVLAITILRSLAYAFDRWEALGAESGFPIAEEHWHVTEYYNNIRENAKKVPGCYGNTTYKITGKDDFWPNRICNLPLQGRSVWGPRYNPMESSLLSIMKPNVFGDVDPGMKTNAYMLGPVYLPPDRLTPWTAPPDVSEPFAPSIAAARRLAVEEHDRRQLRTIHSKDGYRGNHEAIARALNVSVDSSAITPGLGIQVNWGLPGVCDGTSHHWCEKTAGNSCLLTGTQDNRGTVCFNGFSGWLVLDVKNVKHGFIGARIENWNVAGADVITTGWTEVNNGGRGNYDKRGRERRLHDEDQARKRQEVLERMKREIEQDILAEDDSTRRQLKGGISCDKGENLFEWAINGEIMGSWNNAQFCEHYTRLGYNFDVIKFMDDESQTGDFELAMRMVPFNGQKGPSMCLTHLYWA